MLIIPKQTEINLINLYSVDNIFIPLPSNREYKRFQFPFIFSVIFPTVSLESYNIELFSPLREKKAEVILSKILSLVWTKRKNISKYIQNSLSNVSNLPEVDKWIEGWIEEHKSYCDI